MTTLNTNPHGGSPPDLFYTPPEEQGEAPSTGPSTPLVEELSENTEIDGGRYTVSSKAVKPTDLLASELFDCMICRGPINEQPDLTGEPGSDNPFPNSVVTTDCGCTRETSVFHQACLQQWAKNSYEVTVEPGLSPIATFPCMVRHEVRFGCLEESIDLSWVPLALSSYFSGLAATTHQGPSCSRPGPTKSLKLKFVHFKPSKNEPTNKLLPKGSPQEDLPPVASLPPKLQEFAQMVVSVGTGNGNLNRLRFGEKADQWQSLGDHFGDGDVPLADGLVDDPLLVLTPDPDQQESKKFSATDSSSYETCCLDDDLIRDAFDSDDDPLIRDGFNLEEITEHEPADIQMADPPANDTASTASSSAEAAQTNAMPPEDPAYDADDEQD